MKNLKLASYLTKDYQIEGISIICRENFEFKFNNKSFPIPKEEIIVVPFKSKSDPTLVVQCHKKIKHSFILKLCDEFNIELSDYKIIRQPDDENLWGYAEIVATIKTDKGEEKHFVGDGEVHKNTLKSGMNCYVYTMMRKRAEDRAIMRALGLYQKGFYSESEDLGSDDIPSSYNESNSRTLDPNISNDLNNIIINNNLSENDIINLASCLFNFKYKHEDLKYMSNIDRKQMLKYLKTYATKTYTQLDEIFIETIKEKEIYAEKAIEAYNELTDNNFKLQGQLSKIDLFNCITLVKNHKIS